MINCTEGKWMVVGIDLTANEEFCKPVCTEGCENGGVCTEPEVCQCTPNYFGNGCQFLKCSESLPQLDEGNFDIE